MEKLKVIFKKTKNNETIAFFPEITANYGKIVSYMHLGQHSEADLEYYHNTKIATPNEYQPLLNELKVIYNNYKLVIKQKINYTDLYNAWK